MTLPFVSMEPAVAATRSGVIGVLTTVGTLESARFAALLESYVGNARILTQSCPGLVEQGNLTGDITRNLVERYTTPLLAHPDPRTDALSFSCTDHWD